MPIRIAIYSDGFKLLHFCESVGEFIITCLSSKKLLSSG